MTSRYKQNDRVISKLVGYIQGTISDNEFADRMIEDINTITSRNSKGKSGKISDEKLVSVIQLLMGTEVFAVKRICDEDNEDEDDQISDISELNNILKDTNIRVVPILETYQIVIVLSVY